MIAHIFTVHVAKRGEELPPFIGGRAARILCQEFAGSTTANWIDSWAHCTVVPGVQVVEIVCPNNVPLNSVISAINIAVKEFMPDLSSLDWVTAHFTSIHCMNQDR